MIDVFVSYSHADVGCAERLSDELAARGLLVWWDRELPAGSLFPTLIQAMIEASRIVVVLWTTSAKGSQFVLSEAYAANRFGRYFGLILENGLEPPPPFNVMHAVTLDKAAFAGDKLDRTVDLLARRAEARAANGDSHQPGPLNASDDARAWIAAVRAGTAEAIEDYLKRTDMRGYFANSANQLLAISRGGAPLGVRQGGPGPLFTPATVVVGSVAFAGGTLVGQTIARLPPTVEAAPDRREEEAEDHDQDSNDAADDSTADKTDGDGHDGDDTDDFDDTDDGDDTVGSEDLDDN